MNWKRRHSALSTRHSVKANSQHQNTGSLPPRRTQDGATQRSAFSNQQRQPVNGAGDQRGWEFVGIAAHDWVIVALRGFFGCVGEAACVDDSAEAHEANRRPDGTFTPINRVSEAVNLPA